MFFSVLTLGHPSEFWKFLFSNLVFTTPEVYLKGCIHCLQGSALWQMTPITTTILYDMSGRKKKQRKLVLSKQESTSYSFGAHLSFDCIQFDKKWNGLWGIFLGCILCSLFSWPGLLVTLPLTHSLTSRHLDIKEMWVMRSHALINKNTNAKTIRLTTRSREGR